MNRPLARARIRDWRLDDADALLRHADNRRVWRNLKDRFPHPYTRMDAERWLTEVCARWPRTQFAIEVDGEAAGAIGLEPQADVFRGSAEIGFWLGEAYWGRGIATDAVRAFTEVALDELGLRRLFAGVFEWNPASMRVLEKAGYAREGLLRRSVVKDGQTIDQVLYARVRE
jgi:RimJ/RimL family protein N-acetyltransferase